MRAILIPILGAAAALTAIILQPTGAAAQGYAAVWHPGSGTQWVRSNMTADEFKAQDKTYFDQGLRIKSLAVRGGKFTAVWQPGSGAQWVRWGMTADEFKAQDKTYFDQGLRITSLEIDGGKFAVVWRPGNGAQWVRWGMTADEFKAQDKTYFDQGLRITSLEIDGGKLAAVWRPGGGAQWVRWGLTAAEFEAQDQTYFGQGLRLAALAIEGNHYAGVWQTGTGTQWVSHSRCWVDFKTEDQAYFGQGLRLGFVKMQDQAIGAYHYPWKGGDLHTVAQGNNSPPPASHNGSQAYAFDFTMPVGTQIRAARAGTVEWLQENLTETYDPNKATTPLEHAVPQRQPEELGQRGAHPPQRRLHQLAFPYPAQRRDREGGRHGAAWPADREFGQHRPHLGTAPAFPGPGRFRRTGASRCRSASAATAKCRRAARRRPPTTPIRTSREAGPRRRSTSRIDLSPGQLAAAARCRAARRGGEAPCGLGMALRLRALVEAIVAHARFRDRLDDAEIGLGAALRAAEGLGPRIRPRSGRRA